ncbi:EIF3F [Auxenochlorella protothecoides x Auxenochlorella symbiontica]|uniref:Eukaryotic translation initiation factor 3 subunit F n=1 Tax=Auxenochlorella protothecoides TaxID=3075 RepID=A0A087SDE5_AUXPR|nr:Eukaryotic translation initiation factor 3 subunit F [Auxenochlorella protothecoides]KFM23749.1 Eukaryotic translation initiation factor 3 subunit F [Auxenochlorella protothecoides]RMZ56925.1 hypothetical protein APUTEX25_004987 [Auxenochlorella protothecoides]|eukprot:RMZ56925.1 hypothetical protein APUTEX25_004987 [Auxenochlorella protothecoides]
MVAPLTLPLGFTESTVQVHPVVLFTICDAYIRRNQGQKRVIGTLLGTVSDGIIDVRSCYAVPHSENNDQVALDVQHHQTMAALQQKVNPREQIVGWFSTHAEVSGSDALIQSFYANECASPALLTVDTSLRDGALAVRAHASRALSIQGRELAREFQEVACRITSTDLEQLGTDLLATEETRLGAQEEEEEVVEALHRLRAALSTAAAYVDAVVAGKTPGNVAVGRALADAVAAVPRFPAHEFEEALSSSQNDVLLTLYFSNLIRAHVALADKLGTMQLPLI